MYNTYMYFNFVVKIIELFKIFSKIKDIISKCKRGGKEEGFI